MLFPCNRRQPAPPCAIPTQRTDGFRFHGFRLTCWASLWIVTGSWHDQRRDQAFVKSLHTFDELVAEELDPAFVAEVGAELGEEYIEELDI